MRQQELVLAALRASVTTLDAKGVAHWLEMEGYPERKRRIPTLRAVLHRLHQTGLITRAGVGRYTVTRE